ncbi:MAG: efflux RND transporter periplasmic adaptor subunit [Fuerstiella sp.]
MKTNTIIIAAIMVAIIAATYAATVPEPAVERSQAQEAVPVSVVTLQPVSNIERQREFSGTLKAARRSHLGFERSARLMKVLVDEGQQVESGQSLAVLDSRKLKTQIRQTSALIDQQTAILSELKSGPRKELVAATKADWQAAQADVRLKKLTLDRINKLYERSSASAQQVDENRLAYEAAVAQQDALYKRFEQQDTGTRKEQIDAQAASIESLEAEKKRLEISLKDSTLVAPFSGTITKRLADEGNILNPGQPLLELVESQKLEAHVGLPTRFTSNLSVNETFQLSTEQIDINGTLKNVVAQVDPATRTQNVILKVHDATRYNLADGQLIRLKMNELIAVDGFRVPTTALSSGDRGLWKAYIAESSETDSSVCVVRDRAVEAVHTDGNWTVVRGTVYPGEHLIVNGVHRVVPGQLVKIQRPKDK